MPEPERRVTRPQRPPGVRREQHGQRSTVGASRHGVREGGGAALHIGVRQDSPAGLLDRFAVCRFDGDGRQSRLGCVVDKDDGSPARHE